MTTANDHTDDTSTETETQVDGTTAVVGFVGKIVSGIGSLLLIAGALTYLWGAWTEMVALHGWRLTAVALIVLAVALKLLAWPVRWYADWRYTRAQVAEVSASE